MRALWTEQSRVGTDEIGWIVEDENSNETSTFATIDSAGTYRVVGVLDATTPEVKIAVNGTVVDSATPDSSNYDTERGTHSVGYARWSDDRHFPGIVDEPMIWESALSDSQIQDDYDRQPWS